MIASTLNKKYDFIKFLFLIISHVIIYMIVIFASYRYMFEYSTFSGERITLAGFLLETGTLSIIGFLTVITTRRYYFSILITLLFYLFFLFINLEKITFLSVPLFHYDLIYINELILAWDIFKQYIPKIILFFIVVVFFIYIFIKHEKQNRLIKKFNLVLTAVLIIFITGIIMNKVSIKKCLYLHYGVGFHRAHMASDAERSGILFNFIKNIIYLEINKKPEQYSKKKIDEINDFLKPLQKNNLSSENSDISLIIYLIESFTDPVKTGIKTSQDSIPFFHRLQQEFESGFVFSPVVGGRSANAEFELLTGFSMQLFNLHSIPYNEIPNRPIPSLARELSNYNYFSSAIHVADLGFFNYKQMYKMQGFNEAISLWGRKNVDKDPAGRFPSDLALVDEIIDVSNKHNKFFIFAFPNSTHGPWKYNAYDESTLNLDMGNTDLFNTYITQIRIYINALNTADLAIKKLINYFSTSKKKVVILIIGDHQPGLPDYRKYYLYNKYKDNDKYVFDTRKDLARAFKKINKDGGLLKYEISNQVPYVLWKNFKTDEATNIVPKPQAMNSLILKIFHTLKITPRSKIYHFLEEYYKTNSFLSLLKFNSKNNNDLTDEQLKLNVYFEAMQYDLLFGEKYLDIQEE